jgi:hypothetical protein
MASPDFQSIKLRGENYNLTPPQAKVIKILFNAYIKGIPTLSQSYILDQLATDPDHVPDRLRDIFKSSPEAWEKLIHMKRKGMYQLNL